MPIGIICTTAEKYLNTKKELLPVLKNQQRIRERETDIDDKLTQNGISKVTEKKNLHCCNFSST